MQDITFYKVKSKENRKLDKDFCVTKNKDLTFINDDIELQKQKLYKFFLIKKGDLVWDISFGLDSDLFLRTLRIGNIYSIKSYLINTALDLSLDIADIEVRYKNNHLNITYYFLGNDTLTITRYI